LHAQARTHSAQSELFHLDFSNFCDNNATLMTNNAEVRMATYETRGKNQYQFRVRRKGFPALTKTFESKEDGHRWAREVESEMDKGAYVSRSEAEQTTLSEGLERYAREITPNKKGAKQELVRIKRWQSGELGSRPLASIRGVDMAKFRDGCRKAGKAENTIRLELALIRHFFEIARKEWGMESLTNPVANITLPKGSKPRDRRLSEFEFAYLTAALRTSSHVVNLQAKQLRDLLSRPPCGKAKSSVSNGMQSTSRNKPLF
jgi:hypothetical protein